MKQRSGNTKYETLNPKQIRITKIQNPKHHFENCDFGFRDCLVFRYSNFEFSQKGGD
jgi:hypothetical protein